MLPRERDLFRLALHSVKERPSPLEIEIYTITRLVTVLAVAMGVLCFAVGIALGGLSPVAGFLFAVGIPAAPEPCHVLARLRLARPIRSRVRSRRLLLRLLVVRLAAWHVAPR